MTDSTISKFEAAISLAAAIEQNMRQSAHFKNRLDAIADAAYQMGLDSLSQTLSGLSQDIIAQHGRIAAAHKAAHLALVGAALDPLP